jgi:predicted GNAT superfamily acetyltransferase
MASAAKTNSITFRDIDDIKEIRSVEDLQIAAWGDHERDIVPLTQLIAARHVGGTLIGAFDNERLIGFAYGFYGHISGHIVHHSHMLAVDSEHREHNVGFRLKAEQRQRILADGITNLMTWTFDPLQSLNAHFNFAKLGVVSDTYKVNEYGEQATSFLHQNGTDRLFVKWLLDSPRVERSMTGEPRHQADRTDPRRDTVCLLRNSRNGTPLSEVNIRDAKDSYLATIEIPVDIVSIEHEDFELARKWREETRRAFTDALSEGFLVVDYFFESTHSGRYLLQRTGLDVVGRT